MDETRSRINIQATPNERIGVVRQLWVVIGIAAVLATLFTAWTPLGLFTGNLIDTISKSLGPPQEANVVAGVPSPTPLPKPHIGIVAGHWGNDSGAVCPDNLTEAQVNLNIATIVKQNLSAEGFEVDLLQEFDETLSGYQSLALVSIHADSCDYINDQATGFKVAAALGNGNADRATRLTSCIRDRYMKATNLPYHASSITADMTSYHAFDEVHHDTPAVIIETGFLNLDRQILTQKPDLVAKGITDGILCYVRNESIPLNDAP
jgi:N-acetylmuramoyl-L-alanine amidase